MCATSASDAATSKGKANHRIFTNWLYLATGFFWKSSVFKMHQGIIVCSILTWWIMFQSQFSGDGCLRFASFAESVNQLLYNLPASPKFATLRGWSSVQEGFPMPCLRSESTRGLSLWTLHDVFRRFQSENSAPSSFNGDNWTMPTELAAAHICDRMGESFKSEHEHVAAFDSCVVDLLKLCDLILAFIWQG